jgi:enoyl-CoA hydratase/carnithine racemase
VLMGKPRRVLAAGKEFFYRQLEKNLVEAYADASKVITHNMLGQDAQEGVAAFVGKRKPRWND